MNEAIELPTRSRMARHWPTVWGAVLLAWFLVLCFVPDPRPLSAPEWIVQIVGRLVKYSEPAARLIATLLLRSVGFASFGILFALALKNWKLRWSLPVALILGPLMAVVSQWINYRYFPIIEQIQLAIIATVTGVLIGFVLRGKKMALAMLIVFSVGLFTWGTSTGIPDDLYDACRATALHVFEHEDEIPKGDQGFAKLMQMAFEFAEDNSHRSDAVFPNKAAILALGVIVGEERVAEVAKRTVDSRYHDTIKSIRQRVTLRKRNDLARHFWVSAALAVLADKERTMAVGIAKELMDAAPGGSGFSFVDLTADRAGALFATGATESQGAARRTHSRIRQGVNISDFFPEIEGLPEGLSLDEFQKVYGGLGGEKTNSVVQEIRTRLAQCKGLATN